MEESKENVMNLSKILEKLYASLSVLKGYGSYGIAGAVLVGILVPISSIFLSKKRGKKLRGIPIQVSGEEGYAICNAKNLNNLIEVPWKGATTMANLFEQSCDKYSNKNFLGTRKIISKEISVTSDGKKFEKVHLGDYVWESYGEVFDRVCNFASGIVKLGHDVSVHVAIFLETRAEWFIALQACMRQNITIVTIYSALGEDALIHSLNEAKVSTLICNANQLKKLEAIKSSLKTIENVIYIEDDTSSNDFNFSRGISTWKIISFGQVENLGKQFPSNPNLPSKDNIAVIMYTSGSTGSPKGVMITHGNMVAMVASIVIHIPNLGSNDVYLAYLPLTHIFELVAESFLLSEGCKIGYGTALTMTDTSSKIKKGTKGDASVLKPTIMPAVPAIVDRIKIGIREKIDAKGGMVKKVFNIAYRRRQAAAEGSWLGAWGLERIFWDAIAFKSVRQILGGHVRFVIAGGAPLSRDTQRFISICMGAPVCQGYGLTETTALASFADWDDTTVGRVGPPIACCYVKLVSWKEGGYSIYDKPMPRGEIVIGGSNITAGYLNNQEMTDQVYKVDEKGMTWFYSGDIGQFHPDGCLEIIDRKKGIVKLQHGEYIALGKVEAVLMASSYVNNIMVYADPFYNYCVAIIVPSHDLIKWAQESGIKFNNLTDLCDNVEIIRVVQQSLLKAAKEAKLDKFEIPTKIKLVPDPWTPESGLLTAALKINREKLKNKFKVELQKLYQ